ncbi:sterol desaturase family protein, partial [Pseudomonas sp.]
MRTLFSWLYAPLFFLGFLAAGVWLVSDGWPLPTLLALLAVAVLVATVAERCLPYRTQWNASHKDEPRDLLHALVNEGINGLGVITIPVLAWLLPSPGLWPSHWPLWLQLAVALPIADLGITLVHFASHRSPLLWRLHSVHHSVQRMYGFNGLMKHPLHQTLEALGGVLPLLLLGLPPALAALLGFAVGIQLLLQHSNVDMRIGVLRHVFAWAPVHRLHHLK